MPLILQWLLASLIALTGAALSMSQLRSAGHPIDPRPAGIYLVWALVVGAAWTALTAGAV